MRKVRRGKEGAYTRYVPDSMHMGIDADANDLPPSIGALSVTGRQGGRQGGREGGREGEKINE